MKYIKFAIKNFKGIEKVELDLSKNRIITLVGLNESGKTTIMQALKVFYDLSKGLALNENDKNSFRPKGIDFTGEISLDGVIDYESDDFKKLNAYINSLELDYKIILPKEPLVYTHSLSYVLHVFHEHSRTAIFPCKAQFKNDSGKTEQKNLYDYDKEIWVKILNYVMTNLIPEIIYYEDFIFNIPEEISYKAGTPSTSSKEIEKNTIWQLVLDDILKTVNVNFDSFRRMVFDIWNTDNDTAQNRISQIEEALNKKITESWKGLFQRDSKKINFKEIKITTKTNSGEFLVSFKVKTDDGKLFSINDRSKGCRWFFSFLIFTEFRKNRTSNILFLLDEPASNLHTSAQQKILEAIKELSANSVVVYSTHSQHLINPLWLSGSYIVINDKISEDTLAGDMTFNDTSKIIATKYYSYVGKGKGKTKTSYFQPILDALDFAPSLIEPIPHIVILEGKFDWFALNYINEVILSQAKINFYPGGGRDSLWDIIRLYLSWGIPFIVMLDGDLPGIKSKNAYIKEFEPFLDKRIFTLKDITGQNFCLEDLFEKEDIKNIILSKHPLDAYDSASLEKSKLKELFNRSLNLLAFEKSPIQLSDITIQRFQKIIKFINVHNK